MLGTAVTLMKLGVRDLQTIASGLDAGSAAVIEAILRVVQRHEDVTIVDNPLDDDNFPPLGPPLKRQVSVGTSSKRALYMLRDRISDPSQYKKVIKFLYKTLKHIQSDQSNIEYRRLSKESSEIIDLVVSHPEVEMVLQGLGYIEEEHLFRLVRLNRDHVVRTLTVLTELAAEVGMEIM